MTIKKTLNLRHKRFCEEYLVDLNATKAAIRAGFSRKTADVQASRLLTNVNIQEEVQRLADKRSERTEVTVDRVLEELALIGFSDITDICEIEEGGLIIAKKFEDIPKGKTRLIKAIKEDRVIREVTRGNKTEEMVVHDKIRYELWSKIKALELIGRHLVMFTDKIEYGAAAPDEREFQVTIVHVNDKKEEKKGEEITKKEDEK